MAFNATINITGVADVARRAVDGLASSFNVASSSAVGFVRSMNRIANVNNQVRASVVDAQRSLIDLKSALNGAVSGVIANQIYKMTNLFIGWENQLLAATGSMEGAQAAMKDMLGTVETLGTNLTTSANGFVQLQIAARGSSVGMSEVTDIFESFSGALLLFNADTLKTEGTFRALTQMFSKGVVQAEELRGQLAEHLPGAFQMAARAMGVGTAALGDMLRTGKVLAEDLIPKLADQYTKELGPAIAKAMNSPRAVVNRLITEVDKLAAQIGMLFSDAFVGIVKEMTSAIKSLSAAISENITQIKFVVGVLGSYYIILGTLNAAIMLVVGSVKLLSAALNMVTATNPILRAIAATITLLTVGAGMLAGGLYMVRDTMVAFNAETDTAGDIWTRFLETITGTESVSTKVSNDIGQLSEDMDSLSKGAHQISLGDFATGYKLALQEQFNEIKKGIKTEVDGIFRTIKDSFSSLGDAFVSIGSSDVFASFVDGLNIAGKAIKLVLNIIIFLYKEFEKGVIEVWGKITKATNDATKGLSSNDFINFLTGMAKGVKWAANTIINVLIWLAETIADIFRGISENTAGFWDALWESTSTFSSAPLEQYWNNIREISVAEFDITRDRLGDAFKALEDDTIYGLMGIPDAIGEMSDDAVAELEKMLDKLKMVNADAMTIAERQAWASAFNRMVDEMANEMAEEAAAKIKSLSATAEALATMNEEAGKSSDDLGRKLVELTHEFELLQTNGIEETARKMKQFRAELDYTTAVQAGLAKFSTAKSDDKDAQANFVTYMNNLRTRLDLENQIADKEDEIGKRKDVLKEKTKDETKANIELADAVRELKDAYMGLVSSVDSLDRELRDQGILYDGAIDKVDEYTNKLKEIPDEIQLPKLVSDASNELNVNDTVGISRYRAGQDPLSPTPTSNLGGVNTDLQKLKDLLGEIKALDGIEAQRKYIESFGVEVRNGLESYKAFGDIAVKTNMSNQDLSFTLDSMFDEFGIGAQNATSELDAFGVSVDSTSEKITEMAAKSMRLSSAFSFNSTALNGSATLLQQQDATIQSQKEVRAELEKSIIVIKEYIALKNSQGYLTGGQIEAFQGAVDNAGKQLSILRQKKEEQIKIDTLLIESGQQTIWTYKMSAEEIKGLSASYDTALSRARELTKAFADINTLVAKGEMTEFEASIKKAEATIESLHPLARSIGDAFSDAFKSIIDGSASAEEAFANMLRGIADAVYEELVAKQIVSIIGSLFNFGGSSGGVGTFTTGTGFNWAKGGIMSEAGSVDLKSFADGGIAGNPNAISFMKAANDSVNFKAYSSGGVTSKPMLSLFGEGTTPEAYVPLPDGRSIPVTMKAEGTTPSNANQTKPEVKVVVNNLPGQNAEVSRDNQGGLTIDIVRASLATDVNKGGVPWVGAMERRYGMSRGHAR